MLSATGFCAFAGASCAEIKPIRAARSARYTLAERCRAVIPLFLGSCRLDLTLMASRRPTKRSPPSWPNAASRTSARPSSTTSATTRSSTSLRTATSGARPAARAARAPPQGRRGPQRGAGRARAGGDAAARFAPPPPPPQGSRKPPSRPPPPAAPASPRNEDNLCELCADREVDCKIAGCEHKFCRVCVDLWRPRERPQGPTEHHVPELPPPFTEVVDLGTGAAAAAAPPRPAWGVAPPPPPRGVIARGGGRGGGARPRREAEAARERAAAEARRREETARGHRVAAEDAAAVATFYAAREAAQWALRAGTGKTAAEVRAEASERARAAMWGAGATMAAVSAYVEAYAAAATGAFVDAEARALAKDRDDAAAAVISAFIGEVVAATRRDAASAALAESSRPEVGGLEAAFEEFAAENGGGHRAAGGSMLASRLPAACSQVQPRAGFQGPRHRRCRRLRRASRASASATAIRPRRLLTVAHGCVGEYLGGRAAFWRRRRTEAADKLQARPGFGATPVTTPTSS